MADTIKTKAALIIELADNTTGLIDAQVLRDVLVSIMGCYGGVKIEAGSTGQAILSGAAEVMTEWTADGVADGVTPAFASDQITIDNAGVYDIHFDCSFQGITNCTFQFELYKNGSPIGPACERRTTSADVGNCGFDDDLTLAATDVLTIWVEGTQNGTFTATEAHFKVKRIG